MFFAVRWLEWYGKVNSIYVKFDLRKALWNRLLVSVKNWLYGWIGIIYFLISHLALLWDIQTNTSETEAWALSTGSGYLSAAAGSVFWGLRAFLKCLTVIGLLNLSRDLKRRTSHPWNRGQALGASDYVTSIDDIEAFKNHWKLVYSCHCLNRWACEISP